MTELATKAFGTIMVDPAQIISFKEGLYGFPEETEFALLDEKEESAFQWLQSTSEQSLAFILIQPELFMKEAYVPALMENELESLQIQKVDECLVFLIVTIPHDNPNQMTANLQGPILVNKEKMIGRQVISNNDSHQVRVSILEQLED